MGETRINLKHLLEDLRDSYPYPIEEVIITELVANALDSGTSEIAFTVDVERKALSVLDNGCGMKKKELKTYHDIASTTKKRGKGIGFAGIGVKLALLIAESVATETKSSHFHGATSWHLKNPMKAPWQRIEPQGIVHGQGTAVTIYLNGGGLSLLEASFIKEVVFRHYWPLFSAHFDPILKLIYKKGVRFFINGEPLAAAGPASQPHSGGLGRLESQGDATSSGGGDSATGPGRPTEELHKSFFVRLGRQRSPVGIGFVYKSREPLQEKEEGVGVCAFGKVIKRGWEWLGLAPKSAHFIAGAVEIPELAKILTINKAGFLGDSASLKQFYRYRRAIQNALVPILQEFGEEMYLDKGKAGQRVRPMEKEIGRVLGGLVTDFPVLGPIVGWKPASEKDGKIRAVPRGPEPVVELLSEQASVELASKEAPLLLLPETRQMPEAAQPPQSAGPKTEKSQAKRPALTIAFSEDQERKELGWLVENTIWINKAHPAFSKAQLLGQNNYHLAFTVAWVLSAYLETENSQRNFLSRFMELWGRTG
ncbi:MAG: ATP-binding protein [Elusimicrobia bacterium]|nr:ATP-binding protein [Elusimicrobiota bacterium]